MAGLRRCKSCALPFPVRAEFQKCPVCQTQTEIMLTSELPKDWEDQLQAALDKREVSKEADKVVAHRLSRFRKLGYGWEIATWMASRHQGPDTIDLHQVEDLIANGASLDQAVRIAS